MSFVVGWIRRSTTALCVASHRVQIEPLNLVYVTKRTIGRCRNLHSPIFHLLSSHRRAVGRFPVYVKSRIHLNYSHSLHKFKFTFYKITRAHLSQVQKMQSQRARTRTHRIDVLKAEKNGNEEKSKLIRFCAPFMFTLRIIMCVCVRC